MDDFDASDSSSSESDVPSAEPQQQQREQLAPIAVTNGVVAAAEVAEEPAERIVRDAETDRQRTMKKLVTERYLARSREDRKERKDAAVSLLRATTLTGTRRVYSATSTHEVFAPRQSVEEAFYARVSTATATDNMHPLPGQKEREQHKEVKELQSKLFSDMENARLQMVNAASLIQGVLESSDPAARKGAPPVLGVTERVQVSAEGDERGKVAHDLGAVLRLVCLKRIQRHDTVFSVLQEHRVVLAESLQHARVFAAELSALSLLWPLELHGAQRDVFVVSRGQRTRLSQSFDSGSVCLASDRSIRGVVNVSRELHRRRRQKNEDAGELDYSVTLAAPARRLRLRAKLRVALKFVLRTAPLVVVESLALPCDTRVVLAVTVDMTAYTRGTWHVSVGSDGFCRVFNSAHPARASEMVAISQLPETLLPVSAV